MLQIRLLREDSSYHCYHQSETSLPNVSAPAGGFLNNHNQMTKQDQRVNKKGFIHLFSEPKKCW